MPLLFVCEGSVQIASAPSQEGPTLELFSRDGLIGTVFQRTAFLYRRSTA